MEIDIAAFALVAIFALIGLVHGAVVQGIKLAAVAAILVFGLSGAAAAARHLHASRGLHEAAALIGAFLAINGAIYVAGFGVGVLARRSLPARWPGGFANRFLGGVFGMGEGVAFVYVALAVVGAIPGAMVDLGGRPLSQARRESKTFSLIYDRPSMPKFEFAAKAHAIERMTTLAEDIRRLDVSIRQIQAAPGEAVDVAAVETESLKALVATLERDAPDVTALTQNREVRRTVRNHLRRGRFISAMEIPEIKILVDDPAVQANILSVLSREFDAKRRELETARRQSTLRN